MFAVAFIGTKCYIRLLDKSYVSLIEVKNRHELAIALLKENKNNTPLRNASNVDLFFIEEMKNDVPHTMNKRVGISLICC